MAVVAEIDFGMTSSIAKNSVYGVDQSSLTYQLHGAGAVGAALALERRSKCVRSA
jgi:hypothetical protein